MFGTPITGKEKLVSEFADMLDSSNMEAWPYVDLTDQCVAYTSSPIRTRAVFERTSPRRFRVV